MATKYEYRCDVQNCPCVLTFVERPAFASGPCRWRREDGSPCGGTLREWVTETHTTTDTELREYVGSFSLDDIVRGMIEFTRDHPTHGFNTAGKDRFLWAARRWLEAHPDGLAELGYLVDVLRRTR